MKKVFLLFVSIFALISCEKFSLRESPAGTISGFAQKGFLVEDSKVTAIAYGRNMQPTGETFSATITGSLGAFSINVEGANADYFELKAEGYYFNEITGQITESPICLEAFVKSSESKANLNLFTTLTKDRIKKLISSGKKYDKAKTQAQVEFLKTVNVLPGADVDFARLDVTGGSDADAVLLFETCLIQNGRSASELTAILQKAASEFKENGTISEKTAEELFQPEKSDIDFEIVYENLYKYYDENGLSKDDLPSYWRYFYLDEDETFAIISAKDFDSNHRDAESPEAYSGIIKVVSLEPFNVFSDVDWITVEKQQIEKEVFEVKVNIAENKSYYERIGNVIFSDLNSNVLKRKELYQGQAFPDIDPKISLYGKGTSEKPYLIECLDDLLYMRDVYNRKDDRVILSRTDGVSRPAHEAQFDLVSDIDLSPVCGPDKGDWIPIGENFGFDGCFSGRQIDENGNIDFYLIGGHKISGLYINNNKLNQGLFGILKGGSITSLEIEGNVSGDGPVGLLAGSSHVFVGYIVTRGSVSSHYDAGGIVGYSRDQIGQCVNYADVTSDLGSCGGITSNIDLIRNCRNYGAITSNLGTVGGIVGGTHYNIENCGNYGNVSGSYKIGGIAGSAGPDRGNIINCYNNGDIRLIMPMSGAVKHGTAGGIVGSVGGFSVENCYSSGTVSFEGEIENEYIGGICGELWTPSYIIEHNYWMQEGLSAVGGERVTFVYDVGYDRNVIENCFRLNQAQMKGEESYDGVLYKAKDGKSYKTLLEALNAFFEDNKGNDVFILPWEYSSTEPFPVISTFYHEF